MMSKRAWEVIVAHFAMAPGEAGIEWASNLGCLAMTQRLAKAALARHLLQCQVVLARQQASELHSLSQLQSRRARVLSGALCIARSQLWFDDELNDDACVSITYLVETHSAVARHVDERVNRVAESVQALRKSAEWALELDELLVAADERVADMVFYLQDALAQVARRAEFEGVPNPAAPLLEIATAFEARFGPRPS
jgi:hypothetical protein